MLEMRKTTRGATDLRKCPGINTSANGGNSRTPKPQSLLTRNAAITSHKYPMAPTTSPASKTKKAYCSNIATPPQPLLAPNRSSKQKYQAACRSVSENTKPQEG